MNDWSACFMFLLKELYSPGPRKSHHSPEQPERLIDLICGREIHNVIMFKSSITFAITITVNTLYSELIKYVKGELVECRAQILEQNTRNSAGQPASMERMNQGHFRLGSFFKLMMG